MFWRAFLLRLGRPPAQDMDDPQPGIKVVEAGISHHIWSLQKIARLSD
jgi:hypothetical protein